MTGPDDFEPCVQQTSVPENHRVKHQINEPTRKQQKIICHPDSDLMCIYSQSSI